LVAGSPTYRAQSPRGARRLASTVAALPESRESGSEDENEDEDENEVLGQDTTIFSMEFSESDDEDGEWFEDGEGCDSTHGWSSHSHAPPHLFKPICIWILVIHGAVVAT
jgi:hypothetical protein